MESDRNLAGNSGDGRDSSGKFTAGNRHGRGNRQAGASAKIRAALLAVVTPDAARRVALKLLERAEQGDLPCARELLDRVIGRPGSEDIERRIEHLEDILVKGLDE